MGAYYLGFNSWDLILRSYDNAFYEKRIKYAFRALDNISPMTFRNEFEPFEPFEPIHINHIKLHTVKQ